MTQQQPEQQPQQQEQPQEQPSETRSPDDFLKQFDELQETVAAMPDKIVDALRQAGATQQQQQAAAQAAQPQQQTDNGPQKKSFGEWWFGK